MSIREEAKQLQPQLVQWRRMFHQCPELKMDTPVTAGKIVDILREIGIQEIRTGIGGPDGNGVAAVIRGEQPGKCLGIRADCDALPIREETGLPFASQNGNMHACGHDAHVAMALGAAKLLWEHRSELKGSVKFIFQPFEEGGNGAEAMINDGVLEDPKVDAMIALHIGNTGGDNARCGEIHYHPLVSSFCSTHFLVDVKGKGSHAGFPQDSKDPLLASCYMITQIQALLSRETRPGIPVILGVNTLHSGDRFNVIPETAHFEGSLRTYLLDGTDHYMRRITEVCQGVAAGLGCTVQVIRDRTVPGVRNDQTMTEILKREAAKIVGEDKVVLVDHLKPAGEDFSSFSEKVPSVYFFLNATFGDGRDYPHHNSKFDIDERVFWEGTGTFASVALHWQDA